jgi:hypothetical protein
MPIFGLEDLGMTIQIRCANSQFVSDSNLGTIDEPMEGWNIGGYAHCKWREKDWVGDSSLKIFTFHTVH